MNYLSQYTDADPHLREWIAVIDPTLEGISSAARKDDGNIAVLQQYDLMYAAPEVSHIADLCTELREELDRLEEEEWTVDVRSQGYLNSRLQAAAAANVETCDTTPASLLQPQQAAASQFPAFSTNAITSMNNGGGGGASTDKSTAPLPPVSANAQAAYSMRRRIEHTWGTCLLAAIHQMPDEEEHHSEMIEEYERMFQRNSEYLRSLRLDSTNATSLLATVKLNEGVITADSVLAAMLKYPSLTTVDLTRVLDFLSECQLPVTVAVAEVFEKAYVRCMKAEGAEEVLANMVAAGLVPLSTRPFAMLFNLRPPFKKVKSVLDYYELMLDYGIAPEPSTLRILTKQCSGMEYASLHFTLRQKSQAAAAAGEDSTAAALVATTAAAVAAGGGGGSAICAAGGPPDSRRKNERAYFETRLEELAEADPATPLLEAMKVIHRAEVEGTSLEGDTLILSALLRLFCNGTTPLRELVIPFSKSLAYRPDKVVYRAASSHSNTNSAEEELGGGAGSAMACPVRVTKDTNAFDFCFEAAADDVLGELEDESSNTNNINSNGRRSSNGHRGGGGGGGDHHSISSNGKNGQPRTNAFQNEEAAYVLQALASYGSVPDNKMLKIVSAYCENKVNGLAVVEQVVRAMFHAGRESRGAMEAVRCSYCHALVNHFVRRHQRNRLLQLIRSFVQQYYEYTELFKADWAGENFDDNGKSFMAFATAAMKPGPIDWALGLFVLVLIMSNYTVSDSIKARLTQFRESDYHRAPHFEVLAQLENCGWSKHSILTCDALMVESFDTSYPPNSGAAAAAVQSEGSAPVGAGHSQRFPRDSASEALKGLGDTAILTAVPGSIYTTSVQEPSSYVNNRGADECPSLFSYMNIALREMGMDKEVMDWFRNRLKQERLAALASPPPHS